MSRFLGTIYAATGRSLDRRRQDLTVERLKAAPHRCVVAQAPDAEVMRVWLLSDDAAFENIADPILYEAVEFIRSGVAFLLLADQAEPLHHVRLGLICMLAFGIYERPRPEQIALMAPATTSSGV